MIGDENFLLVEDYTYQQYSQPVAVSTSITIGDTTIAPVTTINGNSGQATGPTITLSGGSTGYAFSATAGAVTLAVSSAATVRLSISAAQSGTNGDITSFTALTGNTGFSAWSGTADKTSHATYPTTTASVAYVQAEMQGLMDKMKEITEAFKAVEDAFLGWGGLES